MKGTKMRQFRALDKSRRDKRLARSQADPSENDSSRIGREISHLPEDREERHDQSEGSD